MKHLTPSDKQSLVRVQDMLTKSRDSIAAALPKHLTPDRIMRVALTELRTNPNLLRCDPQSLVASIVKASQLGLEVGSALGSAYLVPYGPEATLIVGYRGLIQLARRSGEIVSLTARVVYEKDAFELEYGLEERLRHVPSTDPEQGPITHAYAVAKLVDGGVQFDVMTKAEVDAIRKRSRAGSSGPWVTDYAEMARKTVVRRLAKYLPLSVELADAIMADQDVIQEEKSVSGAVVDDLNASLAASEPEPTPTHEESTEEPETPPQWPKANADGELVDVHGVPYHAKFHAGTKSCTDGGEWRMRRGYDKEVYAAWLQSRKQPAPEQQEQVGDKEMPKVTPQKFDPEAQLKRIQTARDEVDLGLLMDRVELALEEGDIDQDWADDLRATADRRYGELNGQAEVPF